MRLESKPENQPAAWGPAGQQAPKWDAAVARTQAPADAAGDGAYRAGIQSYEEDLHTVARYWERQNLGGSDGIVSESDLKKYLEDQNLPGDLRDALSRLSRSTEQQGKSVYGGARDFGDLDIAWGKEGKGKFEDSTADGRFSDADLAEELSKTSLGPEQRKLVAGVASHWNELADDNGMITQQSLEKVAAKPGNAAPKPGDAADIATSLLNDGSDVRFMLDTGAQRRQPRERGGVSADGKISMADLSAVIPQANPGGLRREEMSLLFGEAQFRTEENPITVEELQAWAKEPYEPVIPMQGNSPGHKPYTRAQAAHDLLDNPDLLNALDIAGEGYDAKLDGRISYTGLLEILQGGSR